MSALSDMPSPAAAETPTAPERVASKETLSPAALEAQMRWAMYQAAVGLAGASDPREGQEWAEAILKTAQATVLLDPGLVMPQGVPPDAITPPSPRIPMDKTAPSGRHVEPGT